MIKADLHIHTDISDGSLNTEEVIKQAKEKGLTHIAITNHDTVKGLKEAIELGKKYNIIVIPGIEISAYDYKRNRKVHLLGYGIDLEGKHITNLCKRLLKDRDEMTLKQVQIIKSLGYDISEEEVKVYGKNSDISYKQHIMQVMIDKGYVKEIYAPLYKELFKNNGPCHMEIKYIDVLEAIDAIIKDNGIVVVAHPGQMKSYELIEELVDRGLVGIEKYHISHSEEDYERVDELVRRYNLIVTGGSDFHGSYAKNRSIGCCIAPSESVKFIEQIIKGKNITKKEVENIIRENFSE